MYWGSWEEEEEEEGLFKADAVNEEDPERDRATQEEEGGGRSVNTTPCRVTPERERERDLYYERYP